MTNTTNERLSASDTAFLKEIAVDVVEASRVKPGETAGTLPANKTGGTLVRPGGRDCYPAFWIRDYAMSLESNLISTSEQKHALLLTAEKQQNGDWQTPTGSFVPDGAIADHICFDGTEIFFPGGYDYNEQGGKWGKLPSLDDHFYFIHMVWWYVKTTGGSEILSQEIKGKQLIDRLDLAFSVPPSREDTHLVYCDFDNRGVTFGFVDIVIHTGELFFCSVLKFRAARELSELHGRLGNTDKAKMYNRIADGLGKVIGRTFSSHKSGLLQASTGKSNQPDVWGSAFAVYADAVEQEYQESICRTLVKAYKEKTLSWRGQIRHVLTSDDYNEKTAWESLSHFCAKNSYQNGAYWGTPLGWVCFAMAKVDEKSAVTLATEYIDELIKGDFRKGKEFGSPWECMHPEDNYKQNPVYMASVTCPLAAFNRLGWL